MYSPFAKGIFGAVVGAVIGAIIWALISWKVGYEIGWIAWGVGGLVGGLALLFSGQPNPALGGVCVVLTVVSICAGKLYAVDFTVDEIIRQQLDESRYQSYLAASAEYSSVREDDQQLREFMIKHEYTDAERAEDISAEELNDMRAQNGERLMAGATNPQTFEVWKADRLRLAKAMFKAEYGTFDVLKGSIGVMDIVFFLLAIVTAFKLGAGSQNETEAQA